MQFFGDSFAVYQIGKSSDMSVLKFQPTAKRNWQTFVTDGMSNLPQPLERFAIKNAAEWTRVEVLLYLPPEQEITQWAINLLSHVAYYPRTNDTFLAWHHTYTSLPPYPNLGKFRHLLFLPPHFEGIEFDSMALADTFLHVLWAVPINDSELDFQKKFRGATLEQRLWPILNSEEPYFNPARKSAV
jgi:hypothetical protein